MEASLCSTVWRDRFEDNAIGLAFLIPSMQLYIQDKLPSKIFKYQVKRSLPIFHGRVFVPLRSLPASRSEKNESSPEEN